MVRFAYSMKISTNKPSIGAVVLEIAPCILKKIVFNLFFTETVASTCNKSKKNVHYVG